MLVGYQGNNSSGPVVYTINTEGRRDETQFTLRDGVRITIFDIARAPDGEIAIVASALTADTRGATFVARISHDRKRQIITRTWPYCPHLVTFAADGSVWTIGNLKDDLATRDIELNVVRRFDASGRMLGSNSVHLGRWGQAEAAFLRASRDRVGWYTGQEYIEFSLSGSEIGRYAGPDVMSSTDITGMALSEDNDVVLSRFGGGKAEFTTLDRQDRTWTAAFVPKEHAPKWARVLGFDGADLVTTTTNGRIARFNTK